MLNRMRWINTILTKPNWLRIGVIVAFGAAIAIRYQAMKAPEAGDTETALSLRTVRTLFPDAAEMKPEAQDAAMSVLDADGHLLGTVIDTTSVSPMYPGYSGPVPCLIGLSADQRVIGVVPFGHSESMSFIDYVAEEGLFTHWNGLSPAEAAAKDVDVITGATLTCDAVSRSVQHALAQYTRQTIVRQKEARTLPWRSIAFGIVLTAGLIHGLFPRRLRRLRPVFLLLNIAVIGVVVGNMLSLSLLRSWLANGVPWRQTSILVAMGALAIVFPLLTGRNLYCSVLCPYGSAQELIATWWPWRRPKLPRRVLSILRSLRGILLVAALLFALRLMSPDFAAWEPFAAFRWRSAPALSLMLAAVFLLLSALTPRLWCRTLCPTGYLIDAWRSSKKRNASTEPHTLCSFERGALIAACAALLALAPRPPTTTPEDDPEQNAVEKATSTGNPTENDSTGSRQRRRRGRRQRLD